MTSQASDWLRYDGVRHALRGGGPLEGAWPEDNRPEFRADFTACWRGYIAEWIIENGSLKLESARPMTRDPRAIEALRKLFVAHDGPVVATWFSGVLEAGYGDESEADYVGFIVWPHYRLFHIDEGKVTKIEERTKAWWYEYHHFGKAPE